MIIGDKRFERHATILIRWDDEHILYRFIKCDTTLTALYASHPYDFLDYDYPYFRGFHVGRWA